MFRGNAEVMLGIQTLGDRIDALAGRIDARLDALAGRIDTLIDAISDIRAELAQHRHDD